jgi:hypothetical protein
LVTLNLCFYKKRTFFRRNIEIFIYRVLVKILFSLLEDHGSNLSESEIFLLIFNHTLEGYKLGSLSHCNECINISINNAAKTPSHTMYAKADYLNWCLNCIDVPTKVNNNDRLAHRAD